MKQHYLRFALVGSLSLAFSLSAVYFPMLIKHQQYTLLVLTWLGVHLSGRLQVLLLWPVQHSLRQMLQQAWVKGRPTEVLDSDAARRHRAQRRSQEVESYVQRLDTWLFQLMPLGFGLLFRLILIDQLLPAARWYAVVVVVTSCGLMGWLSKRGQYLMRESRMACSALFHARTELFYQQDACMDLAREARDCHVLLKQKSI